jgi:hypothetical protein
MWLYIQTWIPLLSISLTAAICFGERHSLWDIQNLVLATFDDSSSDPFADFG